MNTDKKSHPVRLFIRSELAVREGFFEIGDGGFEPLLELDAGLPMEERLGFGDVRAALLGVVGRERLEDNGGGRACEGDDLVGELENAEFGRIADVDGTRFGGIHEANGHFDEVVDIAKRAGLGTIPIDSERLIVERLHDEIGDNAAIVGVHTGSVGVENAGKADGNLVGSMVVKKERLCTPLAFIVARTVPDWVYVAPVVLFLGVLMGITIHFACRGLKDLTLETFG